MGPILVVKNEPGGPVLVVKNEPGGGGGGVLVAKNEPGGGGVLVAKSEPGGPVLVARSGPENIMSLLPSVLLRVHSTSTKCNNANGNKAVIFSSIACHYGDHDFS